MNISKITKRDIQHLKQVSINSLSHLSFLLSQLGQIFSERKEIDEEERKILAEKTNEAHKFLEKPKAAMQAVKESGLIDTLPQKEEILEIQVEANWPNK